MQEMTTPSSAAALLSVYPIHAVKNEKFNDSKISDLRGNVGVIRLDLVLGTTDIFSG